MRLSACLNKVVFLFLIFLCYTVRADEVCWFFSVSIATRRYLHQHAGLTVANCSAANYRGQFDPLQIPAVKPETCSLWDTCSTNTSNWLHNPWCSALLSLSFLPLWGACPRILHVDFSGTWRTGAEQLSSTCCTTLRCLCAHSVPEHLLAFTVCLHCVEPPLLLFLTPLPPSVAHLFSPSPSLCLSPHEILQYASKFPDADSLLSRFSFKASDFFFNRFYRRENHESLSADAAAVPSPPSPPLQTESQLFLGVLSFFQHDFKKLSVRIFAVWSLLLLFFLLLLLSLRASPIDAENLHQEDTDVDQDNIVY